MTESTPQTPTPVGLIKSLDDALRYAFALRELEESPALRMLYGIVIVALESSTAVAREADRQHQGKTHGNSNTTARARTDVRG